MITVEAGKRRLGRSGCRSREYIDHAPIRTERDDVTAAVTCGARLFGAAVRDVRTASVIVLLAFSGLARAGEPCPGDDLVDRLAEQDPAAYARIERAARNIPNAEGVLWRVSEAGKPHSWLFGTLHVADDRLTPLRTPVLDALRTASVVLVEPEQVSDPEGARETQIEAGRRAIRPGGRSLFAIPAADRMKVINLLAARGLLEVAAQQMQPWFLAVIGTTPPCALARAEAGVPNVDWAVVEAARGTGIATEGLESVSEQVDALEAPGDDLAVRVLVDTAALGAGVGDFLETMVGGYLKSRMGLFVAGVRDGLGGPRMRSQLDYLEATLRDRNARMVERASPYLDRGGAFIAVGALHLLGADGLVERLRRRGAVVEKVM